MLQHYIGAHMCELRGTRYYNAVILVTFDFDSRRLDSSANGSRIVLVTTAWLYRAIPVLRVKGSVLWIVTESLTN